MKHMTIEIRRQIALALENRLSFTDIARLTGRAPSTISREIRGHFSVRRTGGGGQNFNQCRNRFSCTITGLCEGCFDRKCKSCVRICNNLCRSFEADPCPKLLKPPYVCNGCEKRSRCTLEKHIYFPPAAQNEYEAVWSESHSGLSYSEDEIRQLDEIISPLIRNGQSPDHILASHREELMVSRSTIYRLMDDGILSAKNLDLPRKVRFGKRKVKRILKIDKRCRINRTYADFLTYQEQHGNPPVVQLDSVEGKKGGKVLLTLHFTVAELMLMFLRESNTSRSVTETFDRIYQMLGHEDFVRIFPVCLADNGSEFSDPGKIEYDWSDTSQVRTRLFYCDPVAPYQKGSAERNHEFIRHVIPKGKPMDDYTQEDIDLLVSHVNSYARPSLGGKSPYDAFSFIYEETILQKLGVRRIDPDDICLKPRLLKTGGRNDESGR